MEVAVVDGAAGGHAQMTGEGRAPLPVRHAVEVRLDGLEQAGEPCTFVAVDLGAELRGAASDGLDVRSGPQAGEQDLALDPLEDDAEPAIVLDDLEDLR
jgi:hypothetical protein